MKKKKDKIKVNAGCTGGGGGCTQITDNQKETYNDSDYLQLPQKDDRTNIDNFKLKV